MIRTCGPGLDEPRRCVDLRPHAAGRKLAFGQERPGRRDVELPDRRLSGLAEVPGHTLDTRQDDEDVRRERRGEE